MAKDSSASNRKLVIKVQNQKAKLMFWLGIVASLILVTDFLSIRQLEQHTGLSVKLQELQKQTHDIVHFDEVLSISALMYTLDSNEKWLNRYRQFETKLETVLEEVQTISPEIGRKLELTVGANKKLIELEHRAFRLVQEGKNTEAQSILNGSIYQIQKSEYAKGIADVSRAIDDAIRQELLLSSEDKISNLNRALALLAFLFLGLGTYFIKYSRNADRSVDSLVKALDDTIVKLSIASKSLKKASESKDIFLANMSHEIRTPMNGVLGMLNLLAKSELNGKQIKQVKLARQSAEILLNLINDILDISKIESGKLEFELIEFDLYKSIESLVKPFETILLEKDTDLEVKIDITKGQMVIGDPTRIGQVINNLISNAIKFTEKGKVRASFRLEPWDDADYRLVAEIFDQGIGIAEENLEKIFIPFAQSETSTTRKFGGTGLGLAICRELIEKMGGQIGVESQLGEGSKFYFWVKLSIPH